MQNNKKAQAISIDIETLSLKPNACIMQIGYCVFDQASNKIEFPVRWSFPTNVQQHLGNAVTLQTLQWWQEENEAMYLRMQRESAALGQTCDDLRNQVQAFADELTQLIAFGSTEIWARGPQFDIACITNLFNIFDIELPWKYNLVRDARTLYAIAAYTCPPWNTQEAGEQHDAGNDAAEEAKHIIAATQKLYNH